MRGPYSKDCIDCLVFVDCIEYVVIVNVLLITPFEDKERQGQRTQSVYGTTAIVS